MQLLCDAIAVPGSRHGLLFNPIAGECGIIRFDRFTRLPVVEIRAGIRIGDTEFTLPLCKDGRRFDLLDQRLTPCTVSFIGLHGASATKVKLTVAAPFRPRDAAFTTTPVLSLRLQATALGGQFRWTRKEVNLKRATIFIELAGPALTIEPAGTDCVDLKFTSIRGTTYEGMTDVWATRDEPVQQMDRLVVTAGVRNGLRFEREVELSKGGSEPLDVSWCTWSDPILEVLGQRLPFKYAESFPGLEAVVEWARRNPNAIFDNAAAVDRLVASNNCGQGVNHLLAQTLHSWAIGSWWGTQGARNWFSVWEGTCYFHSTVDVEYTQSPFYLAVWPELLKYELDWWPSFAKSGEGAIGARGKGTKILSHDMGAHATANGMIYSHDMEIEEVTNYLILSFAYWQRTNDDSMVRKHADTLAAFLRFIQACDTDGNGVPDIGMANTIDDASPAVQFGKEQMYLAVKSLAALQGGAEMLAHLGRTAEATSFREQAGRIRETIHARGWVNTHFATLLRKDGMLRNPWTDKEEHHPEIPGWDAPHIYTVNGLALLDMVGVDIGLRRDWLTQDLREATRRCLREYGCAHTDFVNRNAHASARMEGLAGLAANPGWISMNMLRDMAAFYRGVDLRDMAQRYWEWQVLTNTQEPNVFHETFSGNNLRFYPRGVAIWGYFDALAGQVINRVKGMDRAEPALPGVRVPRLFDADWRSGTAAMVNRDAAV
jgi:hypothetical protein